MSTENDDRPGSDHPAFFRPPSSEGPSALTVGMLLAVLVLGAYVALRWRRAPEAPVAAPDHSPVIPSLPTVTPPAATASPPTVMADSGPPGPHRCERQGQVLYTDKPCAPGSAVSTVNVSDPLNVGGESITLYRCKGAGLFWSRVHCQHRGGYVTRAYTVPARLALADQIAFAQNRMAELTPPPVPQGGVTPVPRAPDEKAWRCKRLKEEVAALDAYARHPLPPGEQDRVRFERKNARDQQFQLRC